MPHHGGTPHGGGPHRRRFGPASADAARGRGWIRSIAMVFDARVRSLPGGTVLVIGLVVTLALCALELVNFDDRWLLFEDIQLPLGPAVGAVALAIAAAKGEQEYASFRWAIALGLALTALNHILRDIPDALPAAAGLGLGIAADGINVLGVCVGIVAVARALGHRLQGEARPAGDAAVALHVFPGLVVEIILWQADEEFPARVSFTVPGHLDRFRSLDAVWGLLNLPTQERLKAPPGDPPDSAGKNDSLRVQ